MSYLSDRLAAYHITDKENTFKAQAEEPGRFCDFRFFTESPPEKDKNGNVIGTNIVINYLTPSGEVAYYNHGSVQTRRFSRIRYFDPDRHGGHKYFQEKGTEMMPFNTPAVIEAYRKKKELKTLYIVEGEFKAFKLSMLGIPAIGIGGIYNFKDTTKSKMHPDIIDVIQTLKVQNVVLIFDKDCIEVKWEEKKDLSKRLNNFYVALNVFNELLKPYNVQLYFSHVTEKPGQKGIDDVLNEPSNDTAAVLGELQSFTAGMPNRFYLYTYQITGLSSYKIKQLFGLANVQNFIELFGKELENHDFRYNGIDYYIDDSGKPVRSWQGAEKHYIRVGTEYFKNIVEEDHNGNKEVSLTKWTIETIKNDYSNPTEFIRQIPKFDAFCNIPENDPAKYRQSIRSEKAGYTSVLYNLYRPLDYEPKEGEWRSINMFLHHIFDYKNLKGQPMYEMALDYLQMIYLHPAQHLPILCLVSKERETGKTTFLNLLHSIFGENMRSLDSERISSQFNGNWAGKLIVGVDESFIDTDKPTVVNRLKMIATNRTIPIERKGHDASEVANFAKLILCSNDVANMLKIESEETRYWVIEVGTIREKDPHMAERMEAEIPAFLHYLKHRTLFYAERTRLWFDSDDYATEALARIQERTQPKVWKGLVEVITEQFAWQKKPRIFIDNKTLIMLLANHGYKQIDAGRINAAMDDHGIERTVNSRDFYYFTDRSTSFNTSGRCYIIHSDKFYTDTQWEALMTPEPEPQQQAEDPF